LTFYGLIKGAQWEKCGFSLDASSGLLIAFRPNVLHEVSPITFGQRFTIAAWFTGESSRQSSEVDQRSSALKGRGQVRRRDRAAKDKVKLTKTRQR
jgi:predicted 2-oxoglutarate/Fe(II)-dependent dioxygenase YbiX